MCMEDVKIARATIWNILNVTANQPPVKICNYSPFRYALIFSAHASAAVTYSTDPAGATGSGFQMSIGQIPIILTLTEVGILVCQPWYAISATSKPLTCWEVLFPQEDFNGQIQNLRS